MDQARAAHRRSAVQINRVMLRSKSIALSYLVAAWCLGCTAAIAQVDSAAIHRFLVDKTPRYTEWREAAIARAQVRGLPIYRRLTGGRVIGLKRLEDGQLLYYATDNENAADTVSSDEVWSGGALGLSLDGAGQKLGIWDGGDVLHTHDELTGRVTNGLEDLSGNPPTPGANNHATHVAGTMIAGGFTSGARGMSSAASLTGWDFYNDELEIAAEQLNIDPVRISNHSYSYITGWSNNVIGEERCGSWIWRG